MAEIGGSVSGKTNSSSKEIASDRWRILRRAILGARHGHTPDSGTTVASVRRFSSFNLFSDIREYQPLTTDPPTRAEPGRRGKWHRYKHHPEGLHCIDVAIKYITESTSLEAMMGFNNTGNICVWPAEEVMAYYCLKHVERFRGATVCELGCGMTGLAGVMLAATQQPSAVLLSDGNCTSVENVKEILQENKREFGSTAVSAEVLVWDNKSITSASPHHSEFDFVLCADCLFFTNLHEELAQVILNLLKPNGTALIFAPRRSGTLDGFCLVAKKWFAVDVSPQYDSVVWERHEALVDNGVYSTDLHYPVCLTLQPIPTQD